MTTTRDPSRENTPQTDAAEGESSRAGRDPNDVLREWDNKPAAIQANYAVLTNALAAALRETLINYRDAVNGGGEG